jgi:hypothetical protein
MKSILTGLRLALTTPLLTSCCVARVLRFERHWVSSSLKHWRLVSSRRECKRDRLLILTEETLTSGSTRSSTSPSSTNGTPSWPMESWYTTSRHCLSPRSARPKMEEDAWWR